MTRVGYGTFPLKEELVWTVPLAVSVGYRLIDTSDNYHNEEFIGRGLAQCTVARDELMVVTKFSAPRKTGRISDCFSASERKLGGRIDVYLLHWPYPFLWKRQWRELENLYLSGRVGAIGVCNFDRRRLARLLKSCRVKPAYNQFERHPLFQQRETERFCREQGIGVMCYSPLARNDDRLLGSPQIVAIAANHRVTPSQVVLRWNVQHGNIPLPASRSEGHIRGNNDINGFALSEAEMNRIDELESGLRIRYDPDRRFTFRQKFGFLALALKLGALEFLRGRKGDR